MTEPKTRPTRAGVKKFINSVEHKTRREDGLRLLDLFIDITGEKAVMWGSSIVGFGRFRYGNTTGKDYDWMMGGFSPRKSSLTLYVMSGFERQKKLLEKLGKHKTGRSCLYINKLADVDEKVLRKIIESDWKYMQKKYGGNS